jgi:putative Mn2+ efflux pump MntP
VDLFFIIIIAFSLSVDSFSASVVCGALSTHKGRNKLVKIPLFFALFQTIAPVSGWMIGQGFEVFIKEIDHWIAFFLLILIGGKMIYSALSDTSHNRIDFMDIPNIISVSIATSIDSLIIGMSFAFLNINIIYSALIIGTVTLMASYAGIFIGYKAKGAFKQKSGIIGGITLIILGIKILSDHLRG